MALAQTLQPAAAEFHLYFSLPLLFNTFINQLSALAPSSLCWLASLEHSGGTRPA